MSKVNKQQIDRIKNIVHPMRFMEVELINNIKIIEKYQKNLIILNQPLNQK